MSRHSSKDETLVVEDLIVASDSATLDGEPVETGASANGDPVDALVAAIATEGEAAAELGPGEVHATPSPSRPGDAAEGLQRIADAQRAVTKARDASDRAKERAKLAREAWEFRVEELGRIIEEVTAPSPPLFGGPLEPASTVLPDQASAILPGDERDAPVTALGLTDTVVAILRDAGLTTVGAIGDYTSGGKSLTSIEAEVDGRVKRITEARAEAIVASLDRFWAGPGGVPGTPAPVPGPTVTVGRDLTGASRAEIREAFAEAGIGPEADG